jgi:hypothetical protein
MPLSLNSDNENPLKINDLGDCAVHTSLLPDGFRAGKTAWRKLGPPPSSK